MIFRSFRWLLPLARIVLLARFCARPSIALAQRVPTQEVTFLSDDTLALHGTLRTPSDHHKKYPCVLFVHGSGPQTRDEADLVVRYDTSFRHGSYRWSEFKVKNVNLEIGRANVLMGLLHKDTLAPTDGSKFVRYQDTVFLFRDLAEYFAKHGVMSLSYDKRSYTYGKVLIAKGRRPAPAALGSVDDYVRDLEAALRYALSNKDIDPQKIYLVAHSQGASGVAQLAALKYPRNIAGVILLAASVEPIDRTMHDQLLGTRAGNLVDTLLHDIRVNKPNSDQIQVLNASGSYWRSWMKMTDSVLVWSKSLTQPVLLLHGSLDLNVNVSSAIVMDSVLHSRKRGSSTLLKIYPGLDHMFRLPWDIEVDSRVKRDICNWILRTK